jgi:hypothetical protein
MQTDILDVVHSKAAKSPSGESQQRREDREGQAQEGTDKTSDSVFSS